MEGFWLIVVTERDEGETEIGKFNRVDGEDSLRHPPQDPSQTCDGGEDPHRAGGLRGEDSVIYICHRTGIADSLYYSWSKEVLEAGKTTPEGLSDQPERQVDPLSKNSIRFGYLMQPTVLRSTLH